MFQRPIPDFVIGPILPFYFACRTLQISQCIRASVLYVLSIHVPYMRGESRGNAPKIVLVRYNYAIWRFDKKSTGVQFEMLRTKHGTDQCWLGMRLLCVVKVR